MGNYGIKVSKVGYDVASSSAENTTFSSSYNTLNILNGSAFSTTTNGSGQATETYNHGLGYKPAFLLYSYLPTTDTVGGVSYSNAYFQASSGFVHPFFWGASGFNHGILATSDVDNVNITFGNKADQNFKTYLYTFIDLAEETTYTPSANPNNYGLRVSQAGYDATSDPDYRMIYSSRYKVFHVLKTGEFDVAASGVTLADGEEDLAKTEVTKSSLGISDGYQPYLLMAYNRNLYTGNEMGGNYFIAGGYIPMTGFYFLNGIDIIQANFSLFMTYDRIVGYIWRCYFKVPFFGDETKTYPAATIGFKYMILDEVMSFS